MPELVMPPHPKLRELHYLKESGVQYRREVGGRELASVCLFHGVHRAEIRWANTGLVVGGSVVGSVVLPVVTVGCWGPCGYVLQWRGSSELEGCRCGLDT